MRDLRKDALWLTLLNLPCDALHSILVRLPSHSLLAFLHAVEQFASAEYFPAVAKSVRDAAEAQVKQHPVGELLCRDGHTYSRCSEQSGTKHVPGASAELCQSVAWASLAFLEKLDRSKNDVQISSQSSVAHLKSGCVWSSGRNEAGQGARESTGDVNGLERTLPLPGVVVADGDFIVSVAAGGRHSAALTASGLLLMSGANDSGQLGSGDYVCRNGWTPVNNPSNLRIAMVACGARHSISLSGDGRVFACGANDHGQLGISCYSGDRNIETCVVGGIQDQHRGGLCALSKVNSIVEVQGIDLQDSTWLGGVSQISAGTAHSIALLSDGRVYAAGDNNQGQLGISPSVKSVSRFVQVETFGHRIQRVACGADTTMLLTQDNMVLVSGKRSTGLCVIGGLGSSQITHLSIGARFAIARTRENDVVFSRCRKRFELLSELEDVPAKDVSSGIGHYVLVTEDGGIMASGRNAFGQVGAGPMGLTIQGGQDARIVRAHRVPLTQVAVPHGYRAVQVAAGEFHTLYLLVQE